MLNRTADMSQLFGGWGSPAFVEPLGYHQGRDTQGESAKSRREKSQAKCMQYSSISITTKQVLLRLPCSSWLENMWKQKTRELELHARSISSIGQQGTGMMRKLYYHNPILHSPGGIQSDAEKTGYGRGGAWIPGNWKKPEMRWHLCFKPLPGSPLGRRVMGEKEWHLWESPSCENIFLILIHPYWWRCNENQNSVRLQSLLAPLVNSMPGT